MKKNFKWLAALAAVGTVIGLIIVYFCRKKNETSEFDGDDFEDEDDFDLDGDLKPVSDREYVPLNKAADASAHNGEAKEADEEPAKEEEESAKNVDAGQTDEGSVSDKE